MRTLPGIPMPRLPVDHPGPKGLAKYTPKQGSKAAGILTAAVAVVQRYGVRLGSREVGYILTRSGYTHDDIKYIEEVVERARRAGYIDFEAISDGRTSEDGAWTVEGPEEIAERVLQDLKTAQLDRQDGQDVRVEVWAEAAAWLARLVPICATYGVDVRSGSGSVPLNAVYETAWRIATDPRPTVILWIGDLDLNGLRNIATPFADDVRQFLIDIYTQQKVDLGNPDGRFVVRRLMVTPEQVESDLIPVTARAEPTDNDVTAGWPWPYKVQAEALLPEDRDRIVTEALDALMDPTPLERVRRREKKLHTAARALLREGR